MKPASRPRPPFAAVFNAIRTSGFTLLEMLVVLVVVVALVYLALPRLPRPRPGLQIHCLNNLKQMNLACILYASDSSDQLVSNRPYTISTPVPTNNWVAGVMDWTANPQTTNRELLLVGALGAYLKSPDVYRCPGDKSESAAGPRTRSYAMNGFMGNGGSESAFAGWKQCLKTSDIRRPTSLFVFADEHANSIDDGFFINNPNQTSAWLDLPAANHGKGEAGFGFADGHSEIHRWMDPGTKQRVNRFGPKPALPLAKRDSGADLAWVLNAMAARDTNSTSELSK